MAPLIVGFGSDVGGDVSSDRASDDSPEYIVTNGPLPPSESRRPPGITAGDHEPSTSTINNT